MWYRIEGSIPANSTYFFQGSKKNKENKIRAKTDIWLDAHLPKIPLSTVPALYN